MFKDTEDPNEIALADIDFIEDVVTATILRYGSTIVSYYMWSYPSRLANVCDPERSAAEREGSWD